MDRILNYSFGQDYGIIQTQIQEPVASEMDSFAILVKDFSPLGGITEFLAWGAAEFLDTFWFLFRFIIYLIKNIHSY